MTLKQDLDFATDVARGAARIVLDHFGKVERLTKRHAEAVTDADRASQRYIVARLKDRYPADGIVGEENDTGDAITFDCPDPAGRVWVIDPIDGTNNFIGGFAGFAVCIGLLDRGMPVLGVVLDVCHDVVYRATQGEGAWKNADRIEVLKTPLGPSSLIMLTSNLLKKDGFMPRWPTVLLTQQEWKVRIIGSAALEAAQVAAGIAHTATTCNGKLWDVAAPAAIVLEAGGVVTDLDGHPIFPFDLKNYTGAKTPFLAATPVALPEMLKVMRDNP